MIHAVNIPHVALHSGQLCLIKIVSVIIVVHIPH